METGEHMKHTIRDRARLRGEVRIYVVEGALTDAESRRLIEGDEELRKRVVERCIVRNLVTNVGRAAIASRIINGASVTIPSHLAVGTNPITPSATDLHLSFEIFRKALSTVAVFNTYYQRYAVNFTPSDFADTVTEMGLFTASAGGDMWAIVAASIVKTSSQSLVAEWRIQVLSS